MAERTLTTVSELFPDRWLKAVHLQGRPVTVTIERVDLEDIRQPDGTRQAKAVLAFERAEKRLILNRTQARALVDICGSERLADWVGRRVVLAPATAENNRPTIAIRAAPVPTPDGDHQQGAGGNGA